jgi:predicted DNA-binding antitoxin AbrB/MazE fold protein
MKPIHAIFENGVFRPTEKVDLPEHCVVVLETRIVMPTQTTGIDEVYAILNERYDSGHKDTAAHHNAHQS